MKAVNSSIGWLVLHAPWLARFVFLLFRRLLPVVTFRVRGVDIRAALPIHQLGGFQRLVRWEQHEPSVLDWIDGFDHGAVFLDVGAAEGTESLYAALRHPDLKRVIALDIGLLGGFNLTANAQLNRTHNVHFYLLAAGNHNGFVEVDEAAGYYKVPGYPELYRTSKFVQCVRIDEFCEHLGVIPNYVKIDVDGPEVDVVAGMVGILGEARLLSLYIETNSEAAKERIDAMLGAKGFEEAGRWGDNAIYRRCSAGAPVKPLLGQSE